MHWTQIQNSLFFKTSTLLYHDPKRAYHTVKHLEKMYAWAKEFNLPYDVDLDKAIATHDTIVDPFGDNEIRSKNFLLSVDPQATYSGELILTTITHELGKDNRLILLDLADFLEEKITRKNSLDLLLEANLMTPEKSDLIIWTGMQAYLGHLLGNITKGVDNGLAGEFEPQFKGILKGIQNTLDYMPTQNHLMKS